MWNNNNVTWQVSAPSGASNPYLAFNNAFVGNTGQVGTWNTNSSANFYNGSASGGLYAGTTNTSVSIGGATATNVAGEWLQIQSSVPVVMKNYYFTDQTFNSVGYQYRLPLQFTIVGSNDGSTWYDIQDGAYTAMPITITGITMPATGATQPYSTAVNNVSTTTSSVSGTQLSQNNITTTTYSTSIVGYTNFRIIIKSVLSGAYGTTSVASGCSGFFWNPTFSPASSAVSLALDTAVPNQLNIGGSLSIGGTSAIKGFAAGSFPYTTSSGTGTITFGYTFANPPLVFGSIIANYPGIVFTITFHTITTTQCQFVKSARNAGATTSNGADEGFSWIAIGV
jgi:hypothetical protein